MNLVRFGNKKVLKNFNCNYLRQAARKVTEITTGEQAFGRQPIYGERALDMVFDFGGIAGGHEGGDFDMVKFFGEKPIVRINTLSSENQILSRLKDVFGDQPIFTREIAAQMKK